MSSVILKTVCPQCGAKSIFHECISNGESLVVCHCCGYGEEIKLIATDNYHFEIDEEGWEIIAINNQNKLIRKQFQGYGVVHYASKIFDSVTYPLASPLTIKGYANILRKFEYQNLDKNRCYLTTWLEKENRVVVMFGNLPTNEVG